MHFDFGNLTFFFFQEETFQTAKETSLAAGGGAGFVAKPSGEGSSEGLVWGQRGTPRQVELLRKAPLPLLRTPPLPKPQRLQSV